MPGGTPHSTLDWPLRSVTGGYTVIWVLPMDVYALEEVVHTADSGDETIF